MPDNFNRDGKIPETTGYKGTLTTKKPRPEVVREFLNYWFEFAEGTVEIAWKDAATGKLNRTAHFNVRDPELEELVYNVNSVGGQDCYFTASTVKNTTGYATDADVACSPGFWVDQDKIEHIEHADSVQHEFTPTAFVYTGTVPEKRRQLWFRLDKPIEDMDLLYDMNERLHGLYHGDASVKTRPAICGCQGPLHGPGRQAARRSMSHGAAQPQAVRIAIR